MSEVSDTSFEHVLDPMERISETLFGLIMALTFICTLGVATANDIKVHTILIGALGGNLHGVSSMAVFICWLASMSRETRS
jgi:hypothetical protein